MAKKTPDAIMTDEEMDEVMESIRKQAPSSEIAELNGIKTKKKRKVLKE